MLAFNWNASPFGALFEWHGTFRIEFDFYRPTTIYPSVDGAWTKIIWCAFSEFFERSQCRNGHKQQHWDHCQVCVNGCTKQRAFVFPTLKLVQYYTVHRHTICHSRAPSHELSLWPTILKLRCNDRFVQTIYTFSKYIYNNKVQVRRCLYNLIGLNSLIIILNYSFVLLPMAWASFG